jgi:hypothetical protein
VRRQRLAADQPRRARQVGDAKAQPSAEDAVEGPAEAAAQRRHAHGRAGREARADHDLALAAPAPEPHDGRPGLAQIGVDGEHPLAAGAAQAVDQRDAVAIAGRRLDVRVRPDLPRRGNVGRRGDDEDLDDTGQRAERGTQTGRVADLRNDARRQHDDDGEIGRRRRHGQ